MIFTTRLEKKKKERKIAAHIVLAASHKEKKSSGCLNDEEMATLVDETCSAQEKKIALAHLADCQECYELWYTLKVNGNGVVKRSPIIKLLNRKNLAMVGSAMAVAASIAVFLNIDHQPFSVNSDKDFAQVVPMTKSIRPLELSTPQVLESSVSDGMAEQQEAESAQEEVENDIVVEMKKRKILSLSPAPVLKKEKPAKMARTMPVGVVRDGDDFQDWLDSVREGCLNENANEKFWVEIIIDGEKLLISKGTSSSVGNDLVDEVLELMTIEYNRESVKQQCVQILAKLAEEKNNR